MDTYDRIMLSLKEQVGKGKRFESAADLAKFCKVDPSFVHKHLQSLAIYLKPLPREGLFHARHHAGFFVAWLKSQIKIQNQHMPQR